MTDSAAKSARLRPGLLISLATLAVAIVLFFVPPPDGISVAMMRSGALTLFAIGFWATGILPIGLTATAFFLFAALFSVQPPEVIFSGFSSTALWLVFGGLVIGVAVSHTGLGARIAHSLVHRFSRSYFTVIVGIALVAMILGFLMPSSMGRVVLLIPIVLALADKLGFAPGSKGRAGMVLATALITFTSAGTLLPALVPGMALAGLAESLYGVTLTYGDFLKLHFPILGLLKAVIVVLVVTWMFNEPPNHGDLEAGTAPMTGGEKQLTFILVVALGFWMTDFLHGISPAWIAMAAALVILLPGMKLVPPKTRTLGANLDFGSVFYVAGVLGMSAMVTKTGLAAVVGQWFLGLIPFTPGADIVNYGALAGLATVIGLVVTNPGVPAVLSPLAQDIATVSGLPITTVLMSQVIGFTNVVLPYQASPIIVAMVMGRVRMADGAKLTLTLTAAGIVFLIPLNFFWWRFVGLIG